MSGKDRLFIGQLPGDITREEIEAYFGQFGVIEDVFLPASTKARRIAFVTYEEKRSMYAALAVKDPAMRGELLNLQQALPKGAPGGGPAAPAPSSRGGGEREGKRIFVNNIPAHTTEDELSQFFGQWGALADVFYTAPRSFGYITFENEQELANCLSAAPLVFKEEELKAEVARPRGGPRDSRGPPPSSSRGGNMMMPMGGSDAYYGMSPFGGNAAPPRRHPGDRGEDDGAENNCRLFVGNCAENMSDNEIKDYFSQFGRVVDVFRGGKDTSRQKGFVFVTFSTPQEMFKAIAQEQHFFNDVELRVMEAAPKPKAGAPRSSAPSVPTEHRLFVGRISKGITDSDITQHFQQYGTITSCYRPRNQKVSRDGCEFGFVIFASAHDLARALSVENHVVAGAELEVKRAKARPERPTEDTRPQEPKQRAQDPYAFQDPYSAYNAYAAAAAQYELAERAAGSMGGSWGLPAAEPANAYAAAFGMRGASKSRDSRYQPY